LFHCCNFYFYYPAAKSKSSRKKQKAELNQKSATPGNDVDAFQNGPPTPSTTPAITPEEKLAPKLEETVRDVVSSSTAPETQASDENHVSETKPDVTSASPEVANHVANYVEDEGQSEDGEVAENNNSSKSQPKLKYDYKDGISFSYFHVLKRVSDSSSMFSSRCRMRG
jgi:type IV secretory pathway VirB10-like protein